MHRELYEVLLTEHNEASSVSWLDKVKPNGREYRECARGFTLLDSEITGKRPINQIKHAATADSSILLGAGDCTSYEIDTNVHELVRKPLGRAEATKGDKNTYFKSDTGGYVNWELDERINVLTTPYVPKWLRC